MLLSSRLKRECLDLYGSNFSRAMPPSSDVSQINLYTPEQLMELTTNLIIRQLKALSMFGDYTDLVTAKPVNGERGNGSRKKILLPPPYPYSPLR